MKIGDLVLTNFFGESHKICMIIKDKESLPHGSDCYLILLPDGKRAYFSESSLLSLDEWNMDEDFII